MIRAKPTKYRGIQFRSKLEAQWAWILDNYCRDLNWDYEPDPYSTPWGWYSPDFIVRERSRPDRPPIEIFMEIKGPRPTSKECEKLEHIGDQLGGWLLVSGSMWDWARKRGDAFYGGVIPGSLWGLAVKGRTSGDPFIEAKNALQWEA